jgi:hypothetical protein
MNMAIQRSLNATSTTTSDDENSRGCSRTNDFNKDSCDSERSVPLSLKCKSRTNGMIHEQRPINEQQRFPKTTRNINRQTQPQSKTAYRRLATGMFLCVAFLSFATNWNDLHGKLLQQSTFLLSYSPDGTGPHPSTLQLEAMDTVLSLIPSIDDITFKSAKSLQGTVSRQTSDLFTIGEPEIESNRVAVSSLEVAPVFTRPPLDTIIDDNNKIIGDPEWLLDFAILGYGKCGTSTMMHWLREHPEIQAFGREKAHFMSRKPGLMVRQLYEQLEEGPYQRGYKAPQDITQTHILDYFRDFWPQAKFILGIRHPVRWFESLYNFRIQNLRIPTDLPHPNDLIGECRQGRYLTCTNKGDFANSLLKLGKQNYPIPRPATELERSIVDRYNRTIPINTERIEYMSNPVFIFELDQLSDGNATRNELFRSDFTKFMGLKEPLPVLPHYIPGMKRETEEQERRDAMKINICNEEYIPVRQELMRLARSSSQWIREVFLNGPKVTVSSKEYFVSILEGWMKDPCSEVVTNAD